MTLPDTYLSPQAALPVLQAIEREDKDYWLHRGPREIDHNWEVSSECWCEPMRLRYEWAHAHRVAELETKLNEFYGVH